MQHSFTTIDDAAMLQGAWDAGTKWAEGLAVGQVFTGCRPAADLLYPEDKLARGLFVLAAMDAMDQMDIYVPDGRVVGGGKLAWVVPDDQITRLEATKRRS